MKSTNTKAIACSLAAATLLVLAATPARALDAYQDRKGLFSGVGLGGGAVLSDDEAGGEFLFDLTLGGGATADLTLALDLDIRYQRFDAERQDWMVVPGPQLDWFIAGGLFIRAGIGLALVFTKGPEVGDVPVPAKQVEDNDFTLGFDASLGLGYEFFANSNLALGLALEGDYYLLDELADIFGICFSLGLRYY
ncbi:MAG TPA: hypothetical protein VM285_08795 [Polyangia bacterium]|nr:hypothetical protein [Polyangia bacterium]